MAVRTAEELQDAARVRMRFCVLLALVHVTACASATQGEDAEALSRTPSESDASIGQSGDDGNATPQMADGEAPLTEEALGLENPNNHACRLESCKLIGERSAAGPRPTCPTSPPQVGEACENAGLECTYGENPSPFCREYFQCSGGIWSTLAGDSCMERSSTCPSEPRDGTMCTVGDEWAWVPCEYPDGVMCFCLGNPLGVPGADGEWECFGPPNNGACPTILPNLGEGCAPTGQFCNYGVQELGCNSPYAEVYCYQGEWEKTSSGCSL